MHCNVKSSFMKCIFAAFLCGGFQALFYLGMKDEIYFSEIIVTFGFSEVHFILVYLIELSLKLLPFFLISNFVWYIYLPAFLYGKYLLFFTMSKSSEVVFKRMYKALCICIYLSIINGSFRYTRGQYFKSNCF